MEEYKEYTLSVGLKDKDTKTQKITTLEAYKILENILMQDGIGGWTITEGRGGYTMLDDKVLVVEPTLEISIIDFERNLFDKVMRVKNHAKIAMNQETVMIKEATIKAGF